MKKLLLATAVATLLSVTAFSATTDTKTATMPAGMNHNNMSSGNGMMNGNMHNMDMSQMMVDGECKMMSDGGMMAKYFTDSEKVDFKKNRDEIQKLKTSENPDWKKIEELNRKNAEIMAKVKTKMMQETHHNNMMNPVQTKPTTAQ